MIIIHLIEAIIDSIFASYYEKHWFRFILKIIGSLFIAFCMALVIANILYFIIENIENIVVTIGAIACFFAVIYSFFQKKPEKVEQSDSSIIEFNPITLETTYNLIRKNLCSIIADVADMIRLRKPATLSQMDSPTHYDIVGNAVIYHYLLIKQSDEVDPYTILGVIQNTIEQRLNNGEIDGITQTHFFYRSQVYPSLMVDNVRDLGNYVQLDIAIASEQYLKYRERRIYNNMNTSGLNRPGDKDF
jgi:hypothetical protein